MNSSEVLEELNSYSDLYSYLSNHTGLTIQDPDDVQSIYSTLKAEVCTQYSDFLNLCITQTHMQHILGYCA